MKLQKVIRKNIFLTVVCCLLIFFFKTDVYAAQGSVTYGSESYLWYTGQVCPIGVYIGSEVPIGSYEICLEYDPATLEYLDGATEVIENKIYLRGGGTEKRYKNMLHFKPIQAGVTNIQAVSALAVSATDVSGGNAAENLEIVQLSTAPITVQSFVNNEVVSLNTAPVNIETFESQTREYTLTVPAETEVLTVEYTLADMNAVAELSDTSLSVGENIITLSVSGTEGINKYTMYVFREEKKEIPAETVPIETLPEKTEPEKNENQTTQSSTVSDGDMQKLPEGNGLNQENKNAEEMAAKKLDPVLLAALIAVSILGLAYLAMLLGRGRIRNTGREKNGEETWQEDNLEIINLEKTVIDISHVTMMFRLNQNEVSSLKEYIIKTIKRQNKYSTLMALNDISFEVKQGEVIGIIGTNGSGKSTLLRIISGALKPSSGKADVDRRKVQMLTLGTGFDMELTAKENVYLNGAIIGYTKEYIDEKYEDIVAFAELEGFMDEKMKNFSSGMVSRLGFAIATMRDAPEVLILDEVLSVGDMFFQKKSIQRIKEMIHSGATVIIVSHSMQTIQNNCSRVVWIEKGNLMMVGDAKEVCKSYQEWQDK